MEKRKIIMCKGLPGSGKSIWVKEFLSSHKNFLIWNRDTLRVMINAGDLSGKSTDVKEKVLRSLRKDFIISAFTHGFNVVLDDCNLAPSNMEAILKFNLPEERPEFELAVDASKWYSVCWDMDQYLRSQTKYAPDDMPEEVYEALSKTREKLHQILGENSVDFND